MRKKEKILNFCFLVDRGAELKGLFLDWACHATHQWESLVILQGLQVTELWKRRSQQFFDDFRARVFTQPSCSCVECSGTRAKARLALGELSLSCPREQQLIHDCYGNGPQRPKPCSWCLSVNSLCYWCSDRKYNTIQSPLGVEKIAISAQMDLSSWVRWLKGRLFLSEVSFEIL